MKAGLQFRCSWRVGPVHVQSRSKGSALCREPRTEVAAFTLVELLVVLFVIMLLAALLLPLLAKAKLQAFRIQCIGNQKQLILAWSLYPGDNHETLVLNGGDTTPSSVQPHLWVYGGNHGDAPTLTNSLYLSGRNFALFSPILSMTTPIYKCPADRSVWDDAGSTLKAPELRSYSMNVYMATVMLEPPIAMPPANIVAPLSLDSQFRLYLRIGDVAADAPANRFVFIDVNPASICTPAFGVDMTQRTMVHYPSDLHGGQGVLAFADGHVETHKWLDPRTKIGIPPGDTYIPHDLSTPANPDLAWIASQTTSQNR